MTQSQSTILPGKWSLLAIVVIAFVIDKVKYLVYGLEGETPSGSNRVLPVDAEHKSKISFPQLHPGCVKNLKENLVKFLKKVKNGTRQGRQDDGDDEGDGEDGIAGVLGNLAEGNGALSVLQSLPAAVPSLVAGLTQFTGAVNQGLNGTDTPNLPSFLVRQGMEAIKFFQALSGAAQPSRVPTPVNVHRIPGSDPNPNRRPRPPTPSYEQYPNEEDYPDEEVKQPLQPTLRPLRPAYGGNDAGLGLRPDYEPIPGGNPFLENADIRRPGSGSNPQSGDEGGPQKTSLWQIYKSFRNKSPGNGTLTDFQLAHPDAFSNELLQSISQSISAVRGQTQNQAVPTDKPSSEIFKQFYPENKNPPKIFNGPNRPTLSVYKPSTSTGGIAIDLSNLALNASLNQEQNNVEEKTTQAASIQAEIEDNSILGLGNKEDLEDKMKPTVNKGTTHSTGSFAQLQLQQAQAMKESNPDGPQFVKSPVSSLLTLQMGEYVPAVSSLHEGDNDILKVGPQTNHEDHFNGIRNKSPYQAVNNVLVVAPRLTPSPLFPTKPPSNLMLSEPIETTTPSPEYSYQFQASNSKDTSASSLYPSNANERPPVDPNNAPRGPTVSAAIPSRYDLKQNYQQVSSSTNQFQEGGVLPPSLLHQNNNPIPVSQVTESSTSATESRTSEKEEAEEESTTPELSSAPIEADLAPPENKQKIPSTSQGTRPSTLHSSSLLASSLSNIAQITKEQDEKRTTTTEKVISVSQTASPQNSKLFQHLLGSLNLPPLLQNPAVLQSIFASQNQALNGNPVPGFNTESPDLQQDIISTTLNSIQDSKSVSEAGVPSLQNLHPFPNAPFLLDKNKAVPSLNNGNSQISTGYNPFSDILQNSGINLPPPSSGGNAIPSFGTPFQNTKPFQFEPPQDTNNFKVSTESFSDLLYRTTASPPLTASNQGSYGSNNFLSGLNFAPTPKYPELQLAEAFPPLGSSTEGQISLQQPNWGWGTHNGPPAFAPSNTNIIGGSTVSNSQNVGTPIQSQQQSQPQPTSFPPFSGPFSFGTGTDQNNNLQEDIVPSTIEPLESSSTDKEINLSELHLNYQNLNGFPESISSFPQSIPPSLAPSSVQSSPLIVNQGSFQGPAQSNGYPSLLPIGTQHFGSFSNTNINLGDSITTEVAQFSTSTAPILSKVTEAAASTSVTSTAPPKGGLGSSFSQKLLGTSAIAEMSKLPYFQQESFRPSALPPYFIGSQNQEDSDEAGDSGTQNSETFTNLLANSSLTSANSDSSLTNSSSLSSSDLSINGTTLKPNSSVSLGDDSVEQLYPNFPPGKPVFWMNMYYPSGLPVLMKVTTTTSSTTMRPRRRRRTTTLPTTTLSPTTESDYYEDEDEDSKIKKKKKTSPDFITFNS